MTWRGSKPDAEIEEYRQLLQTPEQYEEGFSVRTILGVLFIAVVMIPGNIYLDLMIGGSIGAAAEWVTIILFLELAKRSFTVLKRQEIYLLLYVATALGMATAGGPLWNQYFVRSPAAQQFGLSQLIPHWVAPPPDSPALAERTFLHRDWLLPLFLLVMGTVVSRVAAFSAGYVLFRLTSDYERLPFPFAPINAQGAMALAEHSGGEEAWRWRLFSVGAVIGIVWGSVYVAVPVVTGAIFGKAITLIPIPWIDFTPYTGYFLPATPLGFTLHLGPIFAGLVAPFWAVIGTFLGVLLRIILSPLLYRAGLIPHWRLGMDTIQTEWTSGIDFWMSFGIGIALAFALIGIYQLIVGIRERGAENHKPRMLSPPPGRGDFRVTVCLLMFGLTTLWTVGLAKVLLSDRLTGTLFSFLLFFGFVYTPIISFVNARLTGLVGQTVSFPYVQEATIFLSGYQGVEIWFVPFPLADYGGQAAKFREIELTGTRFTSFLKAELVLVPLMLGMTLLYWAYLWKLAPIPSDAYPFVQKMWPLRALQQSVWLTGTARARGWVEGDRQVWQLTGLVGEAWWYWRVRVEVDPDGPDGPQQKRVGQWSHVSRFSTRMSGRGVPEQPPLPLPEHVDGGDPTLPIPQPISPEADTGVTTSSPSLIAQRPEGLGPGADLYFEVDQRPLFDGASLQTSRDRPLLFQSLKPRVIGVGLGAGLGLFVLLSILGLPVLLIFGYVRSLTGLPHTVITEVVGALLARYYFWRKYGRQQWRLYAAVLAVGFAVGMSLMGMASVGIAIIQKSTSTALY